jgi:hypothetical protein
MKTLSLFDLEDIKQEVDHDQERTVSWRFRPSAGTRTRAESTPAEPRLRTSQFEITNAGKLDLRYRLLQVGNLPTSDDQDRLLSRLAKEVNYELRQPVVLLNKGGVPFLAVPQSAPPLASPERGIGPHVAQLTVADENVILDLADLETEDDIAIAIKFLEAAFRAPMLRRDNLWRAGGNGFYTKNARNASDIRAEVDLYPGFVFSVSVEDGRLLVAVDVNVRCIDRQFLSQRIAEGDERDFKRKHCLYLLGNRWYMVQFWGLTGNSIQAQRFRREGEDQTWDIYNYTQEECRRQSSGGALPPWVAQLDPDSAAITYRYPGNGVERYGASALCRLSRATNDREVARLHRESIFEPDKRIRLARDMVTRFFQGAQLNGQALRLATEPFRPPRRVFAVPEQAFNGDTRLRVRTEDRPDEKQVGTAQNEPGKEDSSVQVTSLRGMGQRRLELMKEGHILTRTPFDQQYLLVPKSLERANAEDYQQKLLNVMRRLSATSGYAMTRILYEDRGANTLEKQVRAIQEALDKNGVKSGYGLLILPPKPRPRLHDMLKAKLWPDFQFQCASAGAISRYYARPGVVNRDATGRFNSYVQNCALGLLVVNRKWGWALGQGLHYEVYIGVDVLNQTAGFTFVFNGGRHIYFSDAHCKHRERLLPREMQKALTDNLAAHFAALGLRPKSIVIHRDGRTFTSEIRGVGAAIRDLIARGLLDSDVRVGIVDIRKTSADAVRLYDGDTVDSARNPQVGTYRLRSAKTGLVCTTGEPFRFPGTAKPLAATIAHGDLDIEWVLEDIFALSLGVFTAPDKCARLPLTIKIADDLLEPIAGYADDESELEDEDEEIEIEETWSDG